MITESFLPHLNTNHLEIKANDILINNNIKHPNDIDLEKLIYEKYKNIRVFYSNQDSVVLMKKNKAVIIINNNLDPKKQRQELAEEFCHVLLHSGNQIEYQHDIVLDKQESQAKRMSAYLLCPLFMIKKLKFIENTYLITEELADYFSVTYEFMQYRLKLIFGQDLNLIAYHNKEFYGYMPIE